MTENLLQYIWQFKHFNVSSLHTTDGEKIEIIFPGTFNTNQGPDFLNAKIKTENTLWAGSIELHINTSDWKKHKHSADANYKNVILHVVWKHDDDTYRNAPVLELEPLVSKLLLAKYEEWMLSKEFIPCQHSITTVPPLTWIAWKERLVAERLQKKTSVVFEHLHKTGNNWEESFWHVLAKNFGVKTNAEAFEEIAEKIPVAILAKHKNQIHQVEALLLGAGGLLQENAEDDYANMLKKEFIFLQKKYNLKQITRPLHFLRMRPSNFPTTRLAQLAMLVKNSHHLFSKILELTTAKEAMELLHITANDYWHYHYRLSEKSPYRQKHLGKAMAENIIINTFVPAIFAYGWYHKNENSKQKALMWLMALSKETNSITRGFEKLGIENKSAFDSQALIELKNNYCNKKRCLSCAVGNRLLKGSGEQ